MKNDQFVFFSINLSEYLLGTKRSKQFLQNAALISFKEIITGIKNFQKKPTPKEAMKLAKVFTNSAVWTGSSLLRLGRSLINLSPPVKTPFENQRKLNIITRLAQGDQNLLKNFSDQEIFKSIYRERVHHHLSPQNPPLLKVPKCKTTVVLIDGVLNEIFSTSMFERGLENHG